MSATPTHGNTRRTRTRPTPASVARPDSRMAASSNSTKPTSSPAITVSMVTANVLISIPFLRHLLLLGSSSLSRLQRGSLLGTSSGRLRCMPTKVRLNRSQRHRPEGWFRWFTGVYWPMSCEIDCSKRGAGGVVPRSRASPPGTGAPALEAPPRRCLSARGVPERAARANDLGGDQADES